MSTKRVPTAWHKGGKTAQAMQNLYQATSQACWGQDHTTQATDGAPDLLGEVGVGQGCPPGNEDRDAGDCGTIAGHIGEVHGWVWGSRSGALLARWLVLDQAIQLHVQAWFSHGTGSRRWQAEA